MSSFLVMSIRKSCGCLLTSLLSFLSYFIRVAGINSFNAIYALDIMADIAYIRRPGYALNVSSLLSQQPCRAGQAIARTLLTLLSNTFKRIFYI